MVNCRIPSSSQLQGGRHLKLLQWYGTPPASLDPSFWQLAPISWPFQEKIKHKIFPVSNQLCHASAPGKERLMVFKEKLKNWIHPSLQSHLLWHVTRLPDCAGFHGLSLNILNTSVKVPFDIQCSQTTRLKYVLSIARLMFCGAKEYLNAIVSDFDTSKLLCKTFVLAEDLLTLDPSQHPQTL